jgi:hypothetical protein
MSGADEVPPPRWWTELSHAFGEALSRPLDSRAGRFSSETSRYPSRLMVSVRGERPASAERMRLYHEQVWKRFFVAFHTELPRTAQALGHFCFHRAVSELLSARPPSGHDLSEAVDPWFGAFVEALALVEPAPEARRAPLRSLGLRADRAANATREARRIARVLPEVSTPWLLAKQASLLDEAERRAARARPLVPDVFPEGGVDALGLVTTPPSVSLLRLDYALSLERPAPEREGHSGAPWPAPLSSPLHVVVWRSERGVASRAVDPIFARLLAHARSAPLGPALARTRAALDEAGKDHLRRALEGYARAAFAHGWWAWAREA